ncbi:unnamed protein product [Echinostoma caproni]|uniref:Phospholipid-transporting ATPase IIB n=1 Tax=Echinostoma caproni TaxID=27848 RepID=A0A183B989_9TREM|nr:unnamed protein product [Echinostoma caproni]
MHPRNVCTYEILNLFPFSSESKRMGIILRDRTTRKITFYVKGADTVMKTLVSYTDWYHTAKMSVVDRVEKMQAVVATLETELDVLCLTGVEDKLQEGVRPTLEALRNAGIRVWMLTGDKLETAECIAKSSRLVARDMPVYTFQNVTGRMDAHLELNAFRKRCEHALLITGSAMEVRGYLVSFFCFVSVCFSLFSVVCVVRRLLQNLHAPVSWRRSYRRSITN